MNGKRLVQLRERVRPRMTQRALAIRAGITVNTVSELERGVNDNPELRTLQALAEALGCTVPDLLADPDPEPEEAKR